MPSRQDRQDAEARSLRRSASKRPSGSFSQQGAPAEDFRFPPPADQAQPATQPILVTEEHPPPAEADNAQRHVGFREPARGRARVTSDSRELAESPTEERFPEER